MLRQQGCAYWNKVFLIMKKGQELLEHLKERLEQNLTYESSSCQQMLKTIAWHAEVCEEMKCPLPYCNFFQET